MASLSMQRKARALAMGVATVTVACLAAASGFVLWVLPQGTTSGPKPVEGHLGPEAQDIGGAINPPPFTAGAAVIPIELPARPPLAGYGLLRHNAERSVTTR